MSEEQTTQGPTTALATTEPSKPAGIVNWKWTKQRRRAVQLVVDGRTDKDIAEELGLHKNTIYNWRHAPEFLAEVRLKLEELATRTKLKRIRQTTLLTDVLAGKLATALNDENLSKVATYGREFHAMRMEERQDFGDNVKRVEGKLSIDGHHDVNVQHNVKFRDFLEANAQYIDAEVVAKSETAQDAVVTMAESLLQNTDFLDNLHAADKEAAKDGG